MTGHKTLGVAFSAATLRAQERAIASYREFPRMGFEQALELKQISEGSGQEHETRTRFMSCQPAWTTGGELPWDVLFKDIDGPRPLSTGPGANGGCVYALALLAAARSVEHEEHGLVSSGAVSKSRPGIHVCKRKSPYPLEAAANLVQTIHGVFAGPSLKDRPFIFDVSRVQTGKSFMTRHVEVRQPRNPAAATAGPFLESDARQPLQGVCFTCIITLKRPLPGIDDLQTPVSAQQRYADILSCKRPNQWEPCPQADIDLIKSLFPGAGHGAFPILDMYKVDMKDFNKTRELADRRELLLYRPLRPIPKDDVNGHIACHTFAADRNGLTMLGNLLGYGWNLGSVGSLSYSFYVHTNAEEAVMSDDGWWLLEAAWPRVSAARGMMEAKVWSPEGKHVASAYQDGMVSPAKEPLKVRL